LTDPRTPGWTLSSPAWNRTGDMTTGEIATPHFLATQAGKKAFARGGSAVDATIAAASVLAVVYPHMTSLGGDSWSLFRDPSGRVTAINGTGMYPRDSSLEEFRSLFGEKMPLFGAITSSVPGALRAWETLHQLGGRLSWAELLEDALDLATQGVEVSGSLHRDLQDLGPEIGKDPGCRALFFHPGGHVLTQGEIFTQPGLAQTLSTIADHGPGAFYEGALAARFVEGMQALGSRITLEDLAAQSASVLEPLTMAVGEHTLYTAPPNSQGFVVLQLLKALDPHADRDDVATMAALFASSNDQRDSYLADPDHTEIDLEFLLSDQHIQQLLESTKAPRNTGQPRASGDTVAMSAVDSEGGAVSSLHSIFYAFGARVLEPNTGIMLQNRATSFSLQPDHPARLVPGGRPPSTLLPVIMEGPRSDGHGLEIAAISAMGGRSQAQIQAQLITHLLRGKTAREAVSAPRFVVGAFGADLAEAAVVEKACGGAVIAGVEASGITAMVIEGWDDRCGHAQIVTLTENSLSVGTDPRADGHLGHTS